MQLLVKSPTEPPNSPSFIFLGGGGFKAMLKLLASCGYHWFILRKYYVREYVTAFFFFFFFGIALLLKGTDASRKEKLNSAWSVNCLKDTY